LSGARSCDARVQYDRKDVDDLSKDVDDS